MATAENMYNNWCLEELRGASQVNKDVWLAWFNKGLLIFEKMILEYVSAKQNTSSLVQNITKGESIYELPLDEWIRPDFYSIIQLRVAYDTDKFDQPIYRVCEQISLTDYNIRPTSNIPETWDVKIQWGRQGYGSPMTWKRISRRHPRFVFVDKDHIKIFPTPTKNVENGLFLNYNYIDNALTQLQARWEWDEDNNEWIHEPVDLGTLNLPWYFFDAIEDYITFRLYQAENPEQAQWYYQQFENTLHDNIYGLNKDKRPVEEDFANTTFFSHY